MIKDREIRIGLTQFLAAFLWGATIVCLLGAIVVHATHPWGSSDHGYLVGMIGLGFSAGAATMSIRSYLCVFSTRIKDAFEMGRETEKHREQIRHLR